MNIQERMDSINSVIRDIAEFIQTDDKVKGDFEWKNSKKVWSKNKEDNAILYDSSGNEVSKFEGN